MRTKIWQVLSGALLLSACGGKEEVGTDLPACQFSNTGQLGDFLLPEDLDGIEVRRTAGADGGPSSGWPVLNYGDSCSQLSWDIAEWAEQKLDSAALRHIASRRAQAVHELESAVQRDTESELVRQVLGLPDAALGRRLFKHLDQSLWS